MDLKALDISMSLCSLLDSCSAKRHNNNILHKTGFKLSRKILRLVALVPDAQ